jgi:hypothetical protein
MRWAPRFSHLTVRLFFGGGGGVLVSLRCALFSQKQHRCHVGLCWQSHYAEVLLQYRCVIV